MTDDLIRMGFALILAFGLGVFFGAAIGGMFHVKRSTQGQP